MSAIAIYVVRCDAKGCTRSVTGVTAWEARDDARARGWECGSTMRSRDLCGPHAPAAPVGKP